MGQHKYNPTAIAAKNGEIPPKEKPKLSKKQTEWLIMNMINNELRKRIGIAPSDIYDLGGLAHDRF